MSQDYEIPPPLVPSVEELAELENAQATANEVTSTVLSQRLELEEKRRTITMLQKALVSGIPKLCRSSPDGKAPQKVAKFLRNNWKIK